MHESPLQWLSPSTGVYKTEKYSNSGWIESSTCIPCIFSRHPNLLGTVSTPLHHTSGLQRETGVLVFKVQKCHKQLQDSLNKLLKTEGVKLALEEITHLVVLVRGHRCLYLKFNNSEEVIIELNCWPTAKIFSEYCSLFLISQIFCSMLFSVINLISIVYQCWMKDVKSSFNFCFTCKERKVWE